MGVYIEATYRRNDDSTEIQFWESTADAEFLRWILDRFGRSITRVRFTDEILQSLFDDEDENLWPFDDNEATVTDRCVFIELAKFINKQGWSVFVTVSW